MSIQSISILVGWIFRHFAIVLAAVFVFCAPNVDFATHITWHDQQRSQQIVVLVACLLYLILTAPRLLPVMRMTMRHGYWIPTAIILFFLVGAISSAMAVLPEWAFLEWGVMLALILFAAQIAEEKRSSNVTDVEQFLLWVFFAMAVAYVVKSLMLYAVMVLVGLNLSMPFNVNELFSGFSNPRFFGQFAVMVMPFLVLPAMFWASSTAQRLALGSVPAVWWMLFIASGSRGAWIALMGGSALVFLLAGPCARRWLRWQGICALAGVVVYTILFVLVPTLLAESTGVVLPLDRHYGWASLSLRDVIWSQTVQMIADHPWLGVGPMHYSYYPNGIGAHPHNSILQIVAEWGIPAALLFVSVVTWGAIGWWRHVGTLVKSNPESPRTTIGLALLAALSGAAAHSLVDGVIVMPVSQLTLVLMCGWAWGLALSSSPSLPRSQAAGASWGVRLVAVMAVIAVLQGVYPVLGKLAQREEAYLEAHPGSVLYPRFWVQGWINE